MKSQISSNGFQEQIRGERTKQTSLQSLFFYWLDAPQNPTSWVVPPRHQIGYKKNMIDNMIFPIEKDIPIIWDFHC